MTDRKMELVEDCGRGITQNPSLLSELLLLPTAGNFVFFIVFDIKNLWFICFYILVIEFRLHSLLKICSQCVVWRNYLSRDGCTQMTLTITCLIKSHRLISVTCNSNDSYSLNCTQFDLLCWCSLTRPLSSPYRKRCNLLGDPRLR